MKEYVELLEKAYNNRGPYGTAKLFDVSQIDRITITNLQNKGLIANVNYACHVVTFDITPEGLELINKSNEG